MSKISEQKAWEAYPTPLDNEPFISKGFVEEKNREGYIKGYDQATQDIQEQAEKSVIEKSNGEVTIEDLVAYNQGFKTGRELAMQDFMEKAEKFFTNELYVSISDQICSHNNFTSMLNFIEQFKNYMEEEL